MINSQKGKIATSCLFVTIGFVIGVIVAVLVFAIDIDLLGIPYINKAVRLCENIQIEQNGKRLTIPKGTELVLVKRMPEGDLYNLQIYSFDIHTLVKVEQVEKRSDFFVVTE